MTQEEYSSWDEEDEEQMTSEVVATSTTSNLSTSLFESPMRTSPTTTLSAWQKPTRYHILQNSSLNQILL
jgi:hypothetical protein